MLNDIKDIRHTLCNHRIHMKPDVKPIVVHQHCLNPKMKEVVRNESLLLLEGIISYPIFDSKWVSHAHFVHRNKGLTLAPNDKNEFIP